MNNYDNFLEEILSEIHTARFSAVNKTVNIMMQLYYRIGELIVSKQIEFGWGSNIIGQLANDLKNSEKSSAGFSLTNLKNMRQFYLKYKENDVLRILAFNVPWGHNVLILQKVKSDVKASYYLESSKEYGWTRNTLLNQIKADAYSRHKEIEKQHNFPNTLPQHFAEQANDTLKDVYMFDFLGISKPVLEKEIENKMIENIRDVIIELGYGFAFLGNQYRVQTETKEYFIDLLFYHRKLKCLVAIELKTGDFKPEYAGKMNFYLNILDEYVKEESENPSIGIILCAKRDRIDVEFALKGLTKPIGISEYKLTNNIPAELSDKIPSAKQIEAQILHKIKNSE